MDQHEQPRRARSDAFDNTLPNKLTIEEINAKWNAEMQDSASPAVSVLKPDQDKKLVGERLIKEGKSAVSAVVR